MGRGGIPPEVVKMLENLINWLIWAIFPLFLLFLGALGLYFYFSRQRQALEETWDDLPGRIEALENWQAQELEHQDLSERGKLSAETRRGNAQEQQETYSQGRDIILGKGSMEEKKEAIIALIKAHPSVAMRTARKLNREFGISAALGLPEAELFRQVQGFIEQAKEGEQKEGAPAQQASAGLPKEWGNVKLIT